MKLTTNEIEWLQSSLPNLQYELSSSKIFGKLDFRAAYNSESGEFIIGDDAIKMERYVCDYFKIEVHLGNLDENGWPKVYEVGGRYHRIAEKYNVPIMDLHINSEDGTCCLSIKDGGNRNFRIQDFFPELVIPFFYYLSYTEKYGIATSRKHLWGEYSHGTLGRLEYEAEILNIAKQDLSRNDLCTCGSRKKYKKCHMDEVEYLKRAKNASTSEA